MGALYIQNCVCLMPNYRGVKARMRQISERIEGMSGSSLTFEIRKIPQPQLDEVVSAFREQSRREYEEIIEECTTKFRKEIEFERFRQNLTYEEAEEISSDLEKLKTWLARVVVRDWFGSTGREEAERQVAISEQEFESFERECFAASGGDAAGAGGMAAGELVRSVLPGPNGAVRRRAARRSGRPASRRT